MAIQQIIHRAMSTGAISSVQDHELNTLLFQRDLTPGDMFLLRRLNRALNDGSVVQRDCVPLKIDPLKWRLRALPDHASRITQHG